jgi:hypothetical protein
MIHLVLMKTPRWVDGSGIDARAEGAVDANGTIKSTLFSPPAGTSRSQAKAPDA